MITVNDEGSGVSYAMNTKAGEKYTIVYDLDLTTSTGVKVTASNFGTVLSQKTENVSGTQSISFTATSAVTLLQWTRTRSKDGVDEVFSLDNVTTSVESAENSVAFTTFTPDVLSYSDYYPFGMLVPNRHGQSDSYRYGFNGMEKDDELKGEGNSINYEARMQDPRVGRFLSIDPLTSQFAYYSPYQFAGNTPIWAIDLDGEEEYVYQLKNAKNSEGKTVLGIVFVEENNDLLPDFIEPDRYVLNDLNGNRLDFRFESRHEMNLALHGKTQNEIQEASEEALNDRIRDAQLMGGAFEKAESDDDAMMAESDTEGSGGIVDSQPSTSKTKYGVRTPRKIPNTTPKGASGKIIINNGRTGKQAKLKSLVNDSKVGKSDKGWIKQEINQINRGKRKNIRNPPGKDLAHERGREAAKGYSYKYTNLQNRKDHRNQHKYDNNGRKNKERKPN